VRASQLVIGDSLRLPKQNRCCYGTRSLVFITTKVAGTLATHHKQLHNHFNNTPALLLGLQALFSIKMSNRTFICSSPIPFNDIIALAHRANNNNKRIDYEAPARVIFFASCHLPWTPQWSLSASLSLRIPPTSVHPSVMMRFGKRGFPGLCGYLEVLFRYPCHYYQHQRRWNIIANLMKANNLQFDNNNWLRN
jgi:hypothetical protein